MGVNIVSKIWALFSCMASIATAVGYYFPYWLEGSYIADNGEVVPLYFGVFRRCSYPQAGLDGSIELVIGCGRYSAFMDIPSVFWQISTIIIGTGACLSGLLSLSAMVTLCVSDSFTGLLARAAGMLQLSAGLLVSIGVVIYPNGWDTTQVVQACGYKSGIYRLGDCSLSWAFYTTAAGGAITIVCSVLTCRALRQKSYWTTYQV